ncbi:MAG: glycosyltransferase family 4 protein, partial [Gemmatimonadaceae bacterium]
MRVLIVHHEPRYYGGAEVLLGNFVAALSRAAVGVTVALARESPLADAVPAPAALIRLPVNEKFSPTKFGAQLKVLVRGEHSGDFDVVHGWAARDWELAAAAAKWKRRPAIGTLHDHPRAAYLSTHRRTLMRLVANYALDRLACPSEAVRAACVEAGYAPRKLAVLHNGIPIPAAAVRGDRSGRVRLGFLGVFSEGKGMIGLLEMADRLEVSHPDAWELHIAGTAQTAAAEHLVAEIRARYSARTWWPRVRWRGWAEDQTAFLREIDVLVCPFMQFEAFGLVVCEAAAASVPVVATRMGAIPEIVEDGRTGWLFTAGQWRDGARIIGDLIDDPRKRVTAGEA